MTFEKILRDLKNKNYSPLYFLTGDEPYYIDKIADYITDNVLSDSEKTFNQVILYGKDTEIPEIINAAKRFPMMSKYQVVVVREAQNLDNINDLIYYTDNPLKSTILVINYKYKKLDKRIKLYKSVIDNGILFESKKLFENQVAEWIDSFLDDRGYKIEPSASALLIEYLGNDLSKIANELEKLIISLNARVKTINSTVIENNIGISKDFNNFELQKALIEKDSLKANRIINYFDKNQKNNPIALTITSLYFFFAKILSYHSIKDKSTKNVAAVLKIKPYFVSDYQTAARVYPPGKVEQVISILREYDLKSKGVGNLTTSPGSLLKELIYKILH
jgi:DNA polymerase-3 subunit delta